MPAEECSPSDLGAGCPGSPRHCCCSCPLSLHCTCAISWFPNSNEDFPLSKSQLKMWETKSWASRSCRDKATRQRNSQSNWSWETVVQSSHIINSRSNSLLQTSQKGQPILSLFLPTLLSWCWHEHWCIYRVTRDGELSEGHNAGTAWAKSFTPTWFAPLSALAP